MGRLRLHGVWLQIQLLVLSQGLSNGPRRRGAEAEGSMYLPQRCTSKPR